jgi:hypothetical protein
MQTLTHLFHIGHIVVIFDRYEEEYNALKELNSDGGGDAHVKEDAEQHRVGDQVQ